MKHLTFIILLVSFFSLNIFAQNYQVKKLNGKVYYGNKILTVGDWIKAPDKLTANSPDAAIRLVSTKDGVVVISFLNGKKVVNANSTEKSELYELLVLDYINKYNRHKQTGVMGAPDKFDWFNYFYQYPDSLPRKMLIIEDQRMPFQSRVFPKTLKQFKIMIRTFTKVDSASYELPIKEDSIFFPRLPFSNNKVFKMEVYLVYKDIDGKDKATKITKDPIETYYISKPELNNLIELFSDNSDLGYKTILDAQSDFYHYLDFNFIRFYYPFVQTQLNRVFK